MSLCKYFSPDRAEVLKTRRIRYSQPVAFNDPFEAKPHYIGIADEALLLKAYRNRFRRDLHLMYETLEEDIRTQLSREEFLQFCDAWQPEADEIFRMVLQNEAMPKAKNMMHEAFGGGIGVLSLSEVNDNLLMWAHYAQGHTGFVLEFDETNPFFGGVKLSSDELWGLHKVRYADDRPETNVSDLNMAAILMTKGKVWEYEREWRAFRPLNQAADKKDAQPYPVYLFNLPPNCVQSVLLGARMPIERREILIEAVRNDSEYSHVKLVEATIDEGKYALRLRTL